VILFWNFIKRQIIQALQGDLSVLINKFKKISPYLLNLPLFILAIPFVIFIRLISPVLLIRWCGVLSTRIGHFSANLELYLCEIDSGINLPTQSYYDIFFMEYQPICNMQLYIMWKRVLRIWPKFILYPIKVVNRLIPGGRAHEIINSCEDRDIHNLYDKTKPHLFFTKEEEERGREGLSKLGIPIDSKFICLLVRDSAYLTELSYHSYRDGNIDSYIKAAEEMASRGYYVIRMGVVVNKPMQSQNPKIIDYATNGARDDFMDIYLGAKCTFCISTSSGFDSIPTIFRKPIAFVTVPVAYIYTFSEKFLSITKHHMSKIDNHELSLNEIFDNNVAYAMTSKEFEDNEVYLVENSPEEIRDLVVEMDDLLNNSWVKKNQLIQEESNMNFIKNLSNFHHTNENSQNKKWKYPSQGSSPDSIIHGSIKSLFSRKFLEKNSFFID